MERYGRIQEKDKREIVLLKGFPCAWGKCTFCDYIEDNAHDSEEMIKTNKNILEKNHWRIRKARSNKFRKCFRITSPNPHRYKKES